MQHVGMYCATRTVPAALCTYRAVRAPHATATPAAARSPGRGAGRRKLRSSSNFHPPVPEHCQPARASSRNRLDANPEPGQSRPASHRIRATPRRRRARRRSMCPGPAILFFVLFFVLSCFPESRFTPRLVRSEASRAHCDTRPASRRPSRTASFFSRVCCHSPGTRYATATASPRLPVTVVS